MKYQKEANVVLLVSDEIGFNARICTKVKKAILYSLAENVNPTGKHNIVS